MKRFFNSFSMDFLIAFRNKFILISIGLAILYAVLVNWVIPENISLEETSAYFYDNSSSKIFSQILKNSDNEHYFLNSKEELYDTLSKEKNQPGIIFEDSNFRIIAQGYEDEKTLNIIASQIDMIYLNLSDEYIPYETQTILIKGDSKNSLPFNKKMIPILLATDIILLGFMFSAVMLFQEKKEGGIYAYRVSSAGTINYLLSKTFVNSIIGVIFAFIFSFLTLGFTINYFQFFLIVFLATLLMSVLGILIGQFYDSVSNFVYVIMLAAGFIFIPLIPLFSGSQGNILYKLIPSYYILFGVEELITNGRMQNFLEPVLFLFIEIIIIFLITISITKKILIKR
jgi:hypothetical protein